MALRDENVLLKLKRAQLESIAHLLEVPTVETDSKSGIFHIGPPGYRVSSLSPEQLKRIIDDRLSAVEEQVVRATILTQITLQIKDN